MGLAAGQAKLLMITSRMADNELRAQIINNSKMRLATQSSSASESYVSALNKSVLMMSNYSVNGTKQYQDLNFNSLTAYSPQNNQYGIRNKAGQILVSESDTLKYEAAISAAKKDPKTTGLEEFLKQYGLEKGTTYFDKIPNGAELKKIYEGDMKYDDNAKRISGQHYGYDMSKQSTEYMVYDKLKGRFDETLEQYTAAVIKEMKKQVNTGKPSGHSTEFADKLKEVLQYGISVKPSTSEVMESYEYLKSYYSGWKSKINSSSETAQQFMKEMDHYFSGSYIQFGSGGSATVNRPADIVAIPEGFLMEDDAFIVKSDGAGGYTVELNPDVDSKYKLNGGITNNAGEYSFSYTGENGEAYTTTFKADGTGTTTFNANQDEAAEIVKSMYDYFNAGIINNLDKSKFVNSPGAKAEQDKFYAAAKELSFFIFNDDVGAAEYENLASMDWIINKSGKPTTTIDSTGTITSVPQTITDPDTGIVTTTYPAYQTNFQPIKDVWLIDQMKEKYGEPKYTWIDKNNPNENAEAKAEWYTNLYNRMQQGYKTITKGLASSSEWLQFAFESGLISMEQVDKSKNWISTMYSNCSDITEATDDPNVTLAEAQYKSIMVKIQNKDKRFDMELKNIDTEHNSLQTEYDSIKTQMDKNIERNFKMYS